MSRKWTYEACLLEAKKYKTKAEFLRSCGSAYKIAYRNGWLNDYDWFTLDRHPAGYWDSYDHCYEEAKKYKTISAFQKNAGRAYIVMSFIKRIHGLISLPGGTDGLMIILGSNPKEKRNGIVRLVMRRPRNTIQEVSLVIIVLGLTMLRGKTGGLTIIPGSIFYGR